MSEFAFLESSKLISRKIMKFPHCFLYSYPGDTIDTQLTNIKTSMDNIKTDIDFAKTGTCDRCSQTVDSRLDLLETYKTGVEGFFSDVGGHFETDENLNTIGEFQRNVMAAFNSIRNTLFNHKDAIVNHVSTRLNTIESRTVMRNQFVYNLERKTKCTNAKVKRNNFFSRKKK